MISAQVDELRAMAESVGLAMPQAATLMMEAADTIWELRDSVHRERAEADRLREENERFIIKLNAEHIVRQNVEAENDKLRKELESVGTAAYLYGRSDLKAENAKLRELLQASLRDFRRIYDYDEQDGWQMVDAIDRMVIGMRKLGFDAGRTEQELRIEVN